MANHFIAQLKVLAIFRGLGLLVFGLLFLSLFFTILLFIFVLLVFFLVIYVDFGEDLLVILIALLPPINGGVTDEGKATTTDDLAPLEGHHHNVALFGET